MAAAGLRQPAPGRASARRGALLGGMLVILTTLIASGIRSDGGLRCVLLPGCADARVAIGFPLPFWEKPGLVHPPDAPSSGLDARALAFDLIAAAAMVAVTIAALRTRPRGGGSR